MITSYSRGHQIYFDGGIWRFCDTNSPDNKTRKCVRCGNFPTKEGHDFCLGYIPGAVSACCGHGKEEGYIIK